MIALAGAQLEFEGMIGADDLMTREHPIGHGTPAMGADVVDGVNSVIPRAEYRESKSTYLERPAETFGEFAK